jgi:beta-lactamase superfamily II metal-dependent hydrolase
MLRMRSASRAGNGTYATFGAALASAAFGAILAPGDARSTPPSYDTFHREQRAVYQPNEDDLLRVFIVFIEQGDGIVIQLPRKLSEGAGTGSGDDPTERIEIAIDGGAVPTSASDRFGAFIRDVLNGDRVVEHAVITHHDQDHITGFTELLRQQDIAVSHVYHNGLASWSAGRRGFPAGSSTRPIVRDGDRCMCFVSADSILDDTHVIDSLAELRTAVTANDLQGIYRTLATEVIRRADAHELATFSRAFVGAPFVGEAEANSGIDLGNLSFQVLWPEADLRSYGGRNWGKTINGNSVAFLLRYGEFEMVFTGDMNDSSEEVFMRELGAHTDDLRCDVLKVPHHGSRHAIESFFRAADPVVAVCSMGSKGFQSKQMSAAAWQHPSTDVVQWVGGAHRFYSTFIHERRFKYEDIDTAARREKMIERTNIVIETDGTWFRVVEVPAEQMGLAAIPSVSSTRRGNGTRWIKATE